MPSNKALSAFLHYSIIGIIAYLFMTFEPGLNYAFRLTSALILPFLGMIYRKKYLNQWSDLVTETIISFTALFFWIFYIIPAVYYIGKVGLKNAFTKQKEKS